MITRSRFYLLLLFCVITRATKAQDERFSLLNIGDSAPSLRVNEWIKGTPVQRFEKSKVYVIDFWATWCKPCIAGMSHLSRLAREYKNKVVFIGVDVYEWKVNLRNSVEKVKEFVDSMGSRMDIYVATEDSNFTVVDWIEATGEKNNGIPRTFVVNGEGKLAWIGHPLKLEGVLAKMFANTWNIKERLAERNENKRLAALDDSLNLELRYWSRSYRSDDSKKADSMLLLINEIVRQQPKLKYAPFIASNTFSALLKTDPYGAYLYGKKVIVTPSYVGPAYEIIINAIETNRDKLSLPTTIYELGGEAYGTEIALLPYPEIANMPRLYSGMAEMYWRAKNQVNAVDAMEKAIEALRSEKSFSEKDMTALKARLQQYRNK